MNERTNERTVPSMRPETQQALQQLATTVAERMVAEALGRMVTGPLPSDIVATVHPQRPLALPPAPAKRRGRKPGPKPGAKRGRPRSPRRPAPEPSSGGANLDVAGRKCRKCFRLGTAVRVANTPRTVRCSACSFTWDVRAKAGERGEKAPAPAAATTSAKPVKGRCTRCGHPRAAHSGDGECLGDSGRCVCKEFYV